MQEDTFLTFSLHFIMYLYPNYLIINHLGEVHIHTYFTFTACVRVFVFGGASGCETEAATRSRPMPRRKQASKQSEKKRAVAGGKEGGGGGGGDKEG